MPNRTRTTHPAADDGRGDFGIFVLREAGTALKIFSQLILSSMTNTLKSSRSRSRRRRTPSRDIVVGLRARILDGTFVAGQRLPTHVMIEKEFRSTPPTVAKALEVLKRDGFIRAEAGRGMYVASRPPHQHHYALVMGDAAASHLTQFYVALRNEAARFQSAGRRFSIFYDIRNHSDGEDYQRLLGSIRARQLAGLIFSEAPFLLMGSPILEEPGIPRVAISSKAVFAGVPAVYPNQDDFIPKALDYLSSRGRKRVAVITAVTMAQHQPFIEGLTRAAAERGMTCPPHWIHAVHASETRWAAHHVARLLMDLREPPDALMILDDNVVEQATAGLAASNLQIPRDIDVVAHTNFPWPTPAAVPVRRLGYDITTLLGMCVDRIDALRRGEQPRALTLMPAMFEEELASQRTHRSEMAMQ